MSTDPKTPEGAAPVEGGAPTSQPTVPVKESPYQKIVEAPAATVVVPNETEVALAATKKELSEARYKIQMLEKKHKDAPTHGKDEDDDEPETPEASRAAFNTTEDIAKIVRETVEKTLADSGKASVLQGKLATIVDPYHRKAIEAELGFITHPDPEIAFIMAKAAVAQKVAQLTGVVTTTPEVGAPSGDTPIPGKLPEGESEFIKGLRDKYLPKKK